VIVEFFNLVFGEDERSDEFWEHAMPIHLRLKYGPFAFAFSPTENTNLKYSPPSPPPPPPPCPLECGI
jgi:hypothetical protein